MIRATTVTDPRKPDETAPGQPMGVKAMLLSILLPGLIGAGIGIVLAFPILYFGWLHTRPGEWFTTEGDLGDSVLLSLMVGPVVGGAPGSTIGWFRLLIAISREQSRRRP